MKSRALALTATIALVMFAAGCASISLRSGQALRDPNWGEKLEVGTSSRDDVLSVLGEPVGRGRALLPVDEGDAPRTVWTYYYEEASMEDARRLFLFVFLEGDRYDGYLWFSSLPDESAP